MKEIEMSIKKQGFFQYTLRISRRNKRGKNAKKDLSVSLLIGV